MPAAEYPFTVFGSVPVLRAPAEIDMATSGQLRAVLLQWHRRGHAAMVVDLTGTVFCDLAGLRELTRAHQRAVAAGGGLRLVTPARGAFTRIFTLTGLDGIIPHFATVKQALAQLPAAAPAVDAPFRICDCRAAWDREHLAEPAMEADALIRSVGAMNNATARLPAMRAWDKPQALAAIEEAVWWITLVDATLTRHHPRACTTVLAARTPAERPLIKDTLDGLCFVRKSIGQAGLEDIISADPDTRRITRWAWNPVPEPALARLPPRAQARERTRWQAYQASLAGRTIGKTLCRAAAFLTLTSTGAASGTDTS